MKKFQFSLNTVLEYKQQRLDSLKAEHAAAIQLVRRQEDVVADAERRYIELNEEYREEKMTGLTVAEAMTYEMGLQVIETEIRRAKEKLRELERRAEAKRVEVVEARKETTSIEKLREKRLDAYQKEIQKSEERFIDDLVSARAEYRQGVRLES